MSRTPSVLSRIMARLLMSIGTGFVWPGPDASKGFVLVFKTSEQCLRSNQYRQQYIQYQTHLYNCFLSLNNILYLSVWPPETRPGDAPAADRAGVSY